MYFPTEIRFYLIIKLLDKLYKKKKKLKNILSMICLDPPCANPWRPTNKLPQGIHVVMRKTNSYSKQSSIWWDRCCEEDAQKLSRGLKVRPTKSSFETQECEVKEYLSEAAEEWKAWWLWQSALMTHGEWWMMRLERQAREEMNEEAGY